MTDPMEHLGEDVQPKLGPDALVILALIRDTMLTPKPVGREQAALAILSSLISSSCMGFNHEGIEKLLTTQGGGLVNLSIEMADSLLLRLDNPALGART
jgi:hypothetical protein